MSEVGSVQAAVELMAFHGDPELKNRIIAQVNAHRAAGEIVPGPSFWDGTRGSLVGATVHSRDSADFEIATGVARGALAIAEKIWSLGLLRLWLHREPWKGYSASDIESLRAFPATWLEVIAPGADTRGVSRQIMIAVLKLVRQAVETEPALVDLHQLLGELIEGHSSPAATPAASWRGWRVDATAIGSSLREGTYQASLAEIAATAAWPDTPTAGALPDVLEQFVNLSKFDGRRQIQWTVIEEETKRSLDASREKILMDPAARETRALRDFDDMLKSRFPAYSARREELESNVALGTIRRIVTLKDILIGLLSKTDR